MGSGSLTGGPCGSGKEATREAQNRGRGYRGVAGPSRFWSRCGPGLLDVHLSPGLDPGFRPRAWHPVSGRCFPARKGESESPAATSPSQGIGVTSFELARVSTTALRSLNRAIKRRIDFLRSKTPHTRRANAPVVVVVSEPAARLASTGRQPPQLMFLWRGTTAGQSPCKHLLEFGQSRLEAQLAFTAVLHTWTRKLLFHPHLHCIVSGGGLNHPQQLWNAANPRFLFPVKAMSRLFRSKFLDALRLAYDQDELELSANASHLRNPPRFRELKDKLYRIDWVVYSKRPLRRIDGYQRLSEVLEHAQVAA